MIPGMDTAVADRDVTSAARRSRRMVAERVELALEGMTCAACAARIEKSLNRLPGVDAAVNFATESARVDYDRARTASNALLAAVAQGRLCGARPAATRPPSARSMRRVATTRGSALRRELVDRRGPDGALPSADAGDVRPGRVGARRTAAALAATRARNAGAVRDRPALLPRRMARASRRRREHGRAGRRSARRSHGCGARSSPCSGSHAARVLRGVGGDRHAGAARQGARGARASAGTSAALEGLLASAAARSRTSSATDMTSTCRSPMSSSATGSSCAPAKRFRSTARVRRGRCVGRRVAC